MRLTHPTKALQTAIWSSGWPMLHVHAAWVMITGGRRYIRYSLENPPKVFSPYVYEFAEPAGDPSVRSIIVCHTPSNNEMIVWNGFIQIERIEQLPLILIEPSHHRPAPPAIPAN